MTINSLVELAQAIEDSKEIERQDLGNGWEPLKENAAFTRSEWLSLVENGALRIKPEPKVIDLSVLIGGIDCEFSAYPDFNFSVIGKLSRVRGSGNYDCNTYQYKYCRPRLNHIHYWGGGECPLPEGLKVSVYYRDGGNNEMITTAHEGLFLWGHDTEMSDNDIIGFEILGKAEGWLYPWEVE